MLEERRPGALQALLELLGGQGLEALEDLSGPGIDAGDGHGPES